MTLPEHQYKFLFVRNNQTSYHKKRAEINFCSFFMVDSRVIRIHYKSREFSLETLYFYHFGL